MSNDYLWPIAKDGDADAVELAFVAPLRHGADWRTPYRFNVADILVEWAHPTMRADYETWQLDHELGAWRLADDAPGVWQLLLDDDDVCTDCMAHTSYEFDHANCDPEDCAVAADEIADDAFEGFPASWDDVRGPFACADEAAAAYQAHADWKQTQPDATCTLYAEYVIADGGDPVCRHHLAEWFGPILTIPADDDGDDVAKLHRQYFQTRRELGDQLADVPSPRILRELAQLAAYRHQLETADATRRHRDELIAQLGDADDVRQATLAEWAGITQQRVSQLTMERRETMRQVRADLEARIAIANQADANQEPGWTPPHIAIRQERGNGPTLPN